MNDHSEREIRARLDNIERYLVHLGEATGYRYVPLPIDSVPPVVGLDLAALEGVVSPLQAASQPPLQAGAESSLQPGAQLVQPAGEQSPLQADPAFPAGAGWSFEAPSASFGSAAGYGSGASYAFAPSIDRPASHGSMPPPGDLRAGPFGGPAVPPDIVAMARSGQVIQAVKLYRQQTGLKLRDAKAAVTQAVRGY